MRTWILGAIACLHFGCTSTTQGASESSTPLPNEEVRKAWEDQRAREANSPPTISAQPTGPTDADATDAAIKACRARGHEPIVVRVLKAGRSRSGRYADIHLEVTNASAGNLNAVRLSVRLDDIDGAYIDTHDVIAPYLRARQSVTKLVFARTDRDVGHIRVSIATVLDASGDDVSTLFEAVVPD